MALRIIYRCFRRDFDGRSAGGGVGTEAEQTKTTKKSSLEQYTASIILVLYFIFVISLPDIKNRYDRNMRRDDEELSVDAWARSWI